MIYLDHHAASPPSAEVLEHMARVSREAWANPSSLHAKGRHARSLLEQAREQVAGAMAVRPRDIVFTSGGTEACNLGVLGLAAGARGVLTSAIEHPAVSAAVDSLEAVGLPVRRLPMRANEALDAAALAAALPEPGWLVAWQWVNHETGAIQPIGDYAEACHAADAHLFVDATQGVGKLPSAEALAQVDAYAIAGSKISGPSGSGALVLGQHVTPSSHMLGGGQESGRRGGSPGLAAVAGLGLACEGIEARVAEMARVGRLRDRVEARLVDLGGVVNGAEGPRVETVVNASLSGWRGDLLVAALDVEGLATSSGAACSSGVSEPSPVLASMYPDEAWRASHALRVSLGPTTTEDDVEQALTILSRVIPRA